MLDFSHVMLANIGAGLFGASLGSDAGFWAFVAAISSIAGVAVALAGLELARRWNRGTAKRAGEISDEIGAIAKDIAQLTTLTEKVHEENQERERTRVPLPRVAALVEGEETFEPRLVLRPRVIVDREAISRAALAQARESRPEVAPRDRLGLMSSFRPSQRLVEEYDLEVHEFAQDFERALAVREAYEQDLNRIVVVKIRLYNDGSVPLDDARLVLVLGPGLESRTGILKPDELPEIPQFRDPMFIGRLRPSGGGGLLDRISPPDPFLLHSEFRPAARDGEVEWHAGDLQHGAHVDASPLVLATDGPGTYKLSWRIHGDNLLEPRTGEINMAISESPSDDKRLASLGDVGIDANDDYY